MATRAGYAARRGCGVNQNPGEGAEGRRQHRLVLFMPAKISAAVGKALVFLNSDDTPHQISVANGPKTPVFLRGQRAALTFDKAGEYSYICGLHPSMKGTIEVK